MRILLVFLSALGLFVYHSSPAVHASTEKINEIEVPRDYKPVTLQNSPKLRVILETAVKDVIGAFPSGKFADTEISSTLIDLRDPDHLEWADFRGGERFYPASVVKLFYLAAIERQLQDRKVTMTTELSRGIRDMIVDSSNEATQYVLDVITDTSSGAELPQNAFEKWQYKRNRVNRFFSSMGYENINVNQKTFCEDAYGIEQQSRNYKGANRNMLTTNATARLLTEIVLGRLNTPERNTQMMQLLGRDPFSEDTGPEDQAHAFTGKLFISRKMTDSKLWSKAGSTSKSWHDAAYIETPDGLKFVIVIFTENHAADKEVIPTITGKVIDSLRDVH